MAYHVFLSFRGEDTRNKFTAHLYTALSVAGFRTFLDDDGIDRGTNVKLALDKAINEARSSIVVLSENYASSGWCLDELVMILKRTRTSPGARHVVLPVFYHVDPSEVRNQTGKFGEAFQRHEERLVNAETNESEKKCLREKVQEWRMALKELGNLKGDVLRIKADRNESKFIQKIVGTIQKWVKRPILHVASYPVGLESRAENINSWLQDDSNVGVAMIFGMGGIGKTTIAKFVYNLNAERFEASSFLADISEKSKGKGLNGVVPFQRQLLLDILNIHERIRSADEGTGRIEDLISCKRVLIVLDDVAERKHFDALIGMRDWFCQGSKIILTTRNSHLLGYDEVDVRFEVMGLDFNESLELFSWHAFRRSHPIEGYTELSKKVVQNCGGLPLALKVLGSSLSTHSSDIWKNTIQKLAAIPNSEILEKLQISFDILDYCDKELFLHIACFFVGGHKDFVVTILEELYTTAGIQTLIERCLLTINEDNRLMMHQLLQQMGIEIVRRESPDEPGNRSRLCHHKDSFEVLSEKTGTEKIKGLYLDMCHLLEEDSHHVQEKDSRLGESFGAGTAKRPHFQELNDELLFAEEVHSRKRHCSSSSILRSTNNVGKSIDHVELTSDAFTRMRNLKLLLLYYVEIKGRYENFPGGLRCLTWHGFPLTTIPAEFSLKRLVGLDLRHSKLEQVWKEEVFLASLKILNLSHSYDLKYTPIFTGIPNLEKLVLKHCISLVEVDESIGELKRLVLLNLKGCKSLKKLPQGIGNLAFLEKFILSGCSKLDQLPSELKQMKSLTELHANGISQETSMVWSFSKTLHSLPGSLVKLYLSNCSLSSVADCIGSLSSMKELDLGENPVSSLPESIKGLAKLEKLRLSHCQGLKFLPELPITITSLELRDCRSLETMKNLPNWRGGLWSDLLSSLALDIRGSNLTEVQGMFKLMTIENADAEIINELGLSSELETIGNNEVEFYNKKYKVTKGIIQVLNEFGIHNLFLPRSKVPTGWWSSNKGIGPSITFQVPLLLKIQALKVYVVFDRSPFHKDKGNCFGRFVYIRLNNKTKDMKWAYTPWFMGMPVDGSTMDMVWLSYWKMGNQFVLEAGDEVNASAGYVDITCDWEEKQVKEIGVQVVYDESEENGSHHQNATDVGDLSAYKLRRGCYNLCNYDNLLTYYTGHVTEKIIFGDEESD